MRNAWYGPGRKRPVWGLRPESPLKRAPFSGGLSVGSSPVHGALTRGQTGRSRPGPPLGIAIALLLGLVSGAAAQQGATNILPRAALAARHFGNDAPWYEVNIPFFACSDPEIEQIYYYRWKLYKSHLKDIGEQGYGAISSPNS